MFGDVYPGVLQLFGAEWWWGGGQFPDGVLGVLPECEWVKRGPGGRRAARPAPG